jgi:hypothetical protein
VDATVPFNPAAKGQARAPLQPPDFAANRKGERLERREQLYTVVRESLTAAGILSSSYKFKVLSLDSRGRQYLIMMDIDRRYAADTSRMAEIEGLVAHNAKSRHDILVTAVYWRVNETVTAGLTRVSAPGPLAAPHHLRQRRRTLQVLNRVMNPCIADEVAAFKQALASASPAPVSRLPTDSCTPGAVTRFPCRCLRIPRSTTNRSPLSGTQYGDLR